MKASTFRLWLFPSLILLAWLAWVAGVILHGNGWNIASEMGINGANYKRAGEFGDAFGSLSSLMAALAAAGAWHAVSQTRKQSFENTFYSLLAHHNQIVASTDIQAKKRVECDDGKSKLVDGEKYVGRDSYRRLLKNLRLSVAGQKHDNIEDRVISGYKSFYIKYQDDLAHYFRTLYHIIRYIDNSNISDKSFYAKIVRAQLSNSEQVLLMYNCSVGRGRKKFKYLCEIYSLLHNVSIKEDRDHWESVVIRPSIRSIAFREMEIEQWPSKSDLKIETDDDDEASKTQLQSTLRKTSLFIEYLSY